MDPRPRRTRNDRDHRLRRDVPWLLALLLFMTLPAFSAAEGPALTNVLAHSDQGNEIFLKVMIVPMTRTAFETTEALDTLVHQDIHASSGSSPTHQWDNTLYSLDVPVGYTCLLYAYNAGEQSYTYAAVYSGVVDWIVRDAYGGLEPLEEGASWEKHVQIGSSRVGFHFRNPRQRDPAARTDADDLLYGFFRELGGAPE